jgi:hypothetical protein
VTGHHIRPHHHHQQQQQQQQQQPLEIVGDENDRPMSPRKRARHEAISAGPTKLDVAHIESLIRTAFDAERARLAGVVTNHLLIYLTYSEIFIIFLLSFILYYYLFVIY